MIHSLRYFVDHVKILYHINSINDYLSKLLIALVINIIVEY